MKYMHAGIFMAGLATFILSILEVLKYVDRKKRRIPHGRPAGTYEINMDEYF